MTEQDQQEQKLQELMLMGFHETPFHKNLGLRFDVQEDLSVIGRFKKQDHLMGNVPRGMLHGGTLSAVFDSVGGVVCAINVRERLKHKDKQERVKRLGRICTIDLKVDYHMPAKSDEYEARAQIVRMGTSIICVRMELRDGRQRLISSATGNFMY